MRCRAPILLLTCALLALAVPGCGGDDEPDADRGTEDAPALTVPQTDTEETTPDEATETLIEPTTPESTSPSDGGAPAPPSSTPQDAPDNDTPPPADSPAERFEEFCRQNPDSCG